MFAKLKRLAYVITHLWPLYQQFCREDAMKRGLDLGRKMIGEIGYNAAWNVFEASSDALATKTDWFDAGFRLALAEAWAMSTEDAVVQVIADGKPIVKINSYGEWHHV